jgi:hypothetical protein
VTSNAAPPPPASAPRLTVREEPSAAPTTAAPQTSGALALAPEPQPEPDYEPEPDLASEIDPEAYFAADHASESAASPPEAAPSAVAGSLPIDLWRGILARVRARHPAVAATLELAAPNVVTRERLVLGFEPGSFEDGRAEESNAKTLILEEAQAFFGGAAPEVVFDVTARGTRVASVASLDAAKRKAAILEARAAVEKHPLVQQAIAIFDAELKDIRLPAQEA